MIVGYHKGSQADKNSLWYNKKITKKNIFQFVTDYYNGKVLTMDGNYTITPAEKEYLHGIAHEVIYKK